MSSDLTPTGRLHAAAALLDERVKEKITLKAKLKSLEREIKHFKKRIRELEQTEK
jgi:hypothetical protein